MRFKTLFTALLFFAMAAQAQNPAAAVKALPKVDLGIKLGANFEQLNGQTWQSAYKPGIVGGIFIGLRKKRFGVQVEGLVNTATYHLKDSVKTGIRATYISIPLLFEYKVIPMLWVQIGPQYSGVANVQSVNGFTGDAKNVITSGGVSGVIGLELKLPVKLNIGARYILGFSDMNNHALPTTYSGYSDAWKQRTIQVHVGFRFI
jgi:hypothetical protein